MFNYLKQALDSVENQLDSILDTNQTDNSTVPVIPTQHDSNRLTNKLNKLKERDNNRKEINNEISDSENVINQIPTKHIPKMEVVMPPISNPPIPTETDIENTLDKELNKTTADELECNIEHGWAIEEDLDITLATENENGVIELKASDILVPVSELENVSLVDGVGETSPNDKLLSVIHSETHTRVEVPEKVDISESTVEEIEATDKKLIDTLKSSLESATSQYNTLVQESNVQLKALQDRIQEYQNEIQALKKQLNSSMETSSQDKFNADLTKKLAEKEASIVGLLQEGENLAKEILRANNTIKKYKKDLLDTKKDVEVKTKQIEQYQEKIQQLQSKVTELSVQDSQIQENVVQLKDSKKQLEIRVGELEMIHVKQSQEIVDLKTKSDSLQSELDRLKQEQHRETIAIQSQALEEQLKVNAALESQLQTAKQIAQDLQSTIQKIVLSN